MKNNKKKFRFKVGDKVWVKIFVNAIIKRVNKKYGYTLKFNEEEYFYFDDTEVEKVN